MNSYDVAKIHSGRFSHGLLCVWLRSGLQMLHIQWREETYCQRSLSSGWAWSLTSYLLSHSFCHSGLARAVLLKLSVRGNHLQLSSAQFTQSCLTLCNPMDCSTPGLPVHHKLPEFMQSCPLSRWCHPAISSSVALFSWSFPASGSFPKKRWPEY